MEDPSVQEDQQRKTSALLEVPIWESSRFRVARVSVGGCSDNDSSKSLGQLTREALPRAENYRDISGPGQGLRPTLEELHEARLLDQGRSFEKGEKNSRRKSSAHAPRKGKVIKFGWLEGVYMRCLLNIWGVMLFLRLSWVIGQAGIWEGMLVICLANVVTLATTLSMSAVSTNGIIEGGGIYYMISRSLGPEFGGAIGLMFTIANSVAVAMYVVGFSESLQDLMRTFGTQLVDNGTNDIRLVSMVTLVGILVLAFVGMEWVTRTQMCLLIVLIASQLDFMVGSLIGPKTSLEEAKGFVGYHSEVFKQNFWSDYRLFEGVEHDFFSVFSVFFPAVTGIVAGANLSGDLKDPSVAIPRGTLLAIITTFISYISYALMVGGCVLRDASGNASVLLTEGLTPSERWDRLTDCNSTCRFGLHNDNQAMELVSYWGPLIYGGCFAATLSSAIASLVGAPRVLQALAKDRLYPSIEFFAKGYGANNDPGRGYLLVFLIAFGFVLMGQLNYIAPLLSNFFLAAYALINFSVFHVSISKSPGWRPSFKYYNAWVSLCGTLLCIAVMFLISWWTALTTFFVVVTLYLYVSYRKPDVNWGSSTQAQAYYFALRSALELNKVAEHVKNYRPQVLVLSGSPGCRPPLVDFANLITKGKSLLICTQFIKGSHPKRVHDALLDKAQRWFDQHKIKAFFVVGENAGDEPEVGKALMRLSGLGKLRPNMILMGYKADWKTCRPKDLNNYFSLIHVALDSHLAVGILRLADGLDYSAVIEPGQDLEEEEVLTITPGSPVSNCQIVIHRNPSAGQLSLEDAKESDDEECSISTGSGLELDEEMGGGGGGYGLESHSSSDKLSTEGGGVSGYYQGGGGQPLSSRHLAGITCFRRRQPKGFIDVWWLYDDGGRYTVGVSGGYGLESHSSSDKLSTEGGGVSGYYQGGGGQPLSSRHLAGITCFRRRQPKGFIDVWWLYDDGGRYTVGVSGGYGLESHSSSDKLSTEGGGVSGYYQGGGGHPLSSRHLAGITCFRRRQPKGFIDVWWLYDDGGRYTVGGSYGLESHSSSDKLSTEGGGVSGYYQGGGGQPLSSRHLAGITCFRRRQPKGFIDVWWLYDDGGRYTVGGSYGLESHSSSDKLSTEGGGVSGYYQGGGGQPVSSRHLAGITCFRRRQPKGFIDVWWLYDDRGLTLLIPHILSTRSQYADCKLRIFSLANRKNELDRAHRNLAALLSKFRIEYSDLIIIPDITKKARTETVKEFEEIIKNFRADAKREGGGGAEDKEKVEVEEGVTEKSQEISDSELALLSEKTNRHLRLRELLKDHSAESVLVVVTLPMPRKGTVSAPLYLAWLELISADMPPCLILRGNQSSVLTYYS